VMNAAQAAPGRTVRVVASAGGAAPGAGVLTIAVEDEGPGIPPDVMPRLFEPFFTTKPVGLGTGLGLSVSLGIAQRHGGSLHAENRSEGGGGGARLVLTLPLAAPAPAGAVPTPAAAPETSFEPSALDATLRAIVADASTAKV
jgi:signal transduction histidine kinase